jgi:hypothetical protein
MKKFNEFLLEDWQSPLDAKSGESDTPQETETSQSTETETDLSSGLQNPPSKEVESFYSDWGFTEALYGYAGYKTLKGVYKGVKFINGLKNGIAELSTKQVPKSPGLMTKIGKGILNIFRGGAGKVGEQTVLEFGKTVAKNPSLWARLGGMMLTSTGGTGALTGTIGFLGLTPVGWITLGVLAISGIFIYTFWNDEMYEIDEIWKSKKHHKGKQDSFTKEIYDLITKGLFSSRVLGTGIIEQFAKINKSKSFGKDEYLVIRLSNEALVRDGVRYDEGVEQLDNIFKNSEMQRNLIGTSTTSADWISDIKKNYDGLSISGKQNLDDYGTIKQFVAKWMFENSSNDKNYYGKSLAEDSEGWFDTKFDTATPGMKPLGYATYFLSEEYLNNINSLGSLKDRKFLWMVMQSYWITKISNLDATTFSINQFCKLVGVISGGVENPYTDPAFVSNLKYWKYSDKGGITGAGECKQMGSFQELLTAVGVYITEQSRTIAQESDNPSVVSNLTISFALLWATYSLMYQIQVGSLVTFGQLSYLTWLHKEETEINKLNITPSKQSGNFKSGYSSTNQVTEPKAPVNIEEFIDKVDTIADIDKFEG